MRCKHVPEREAADLREQPQKGSGQKVQPGKSTSASMAMEVRPNTYLAGLALNEVAERS